MSPFKDIKNTGAITSLPLAQAGDAVVPKHVVTGSAFPRIHPGSMFRDGSKQEQAQWMTACNVCDLIIYN